MTWEEYRAFIEAHAHGISGGDPADVLPYYRGHIQRFEVGFRMMQDIHPQSVLDVGTSFPFYSWLFALRDGADVLFGCPPARDHYVDDRVHGVPLDVCMSRALPAADLVIATEMLEHLWCDVERIVDMIAAAAKRWVFLSFPCGGKNAGGYNENLETKRGSLRDHLREFTGASALEMAKRVGGRVIASESVPTSLYHAPIAHYLIEVDHGEA